MIDLEPLGDRAFLARFASEDLARRWAEGVRRSFARGVEEVVLAYRSVAVFADSGLDDLDTLENFLRQIPPVDPSISVGVRHLIPVLYDGDDLADVARTLRKTEAEVMALHAFREYTIKAVGFLPGFAYAGDLPAELAGLPRRDRPRLRVPGGSVAIAGLQTGVYPDDSPGGWHLLGRTPLKVVDLEAGHFPLSAGDILSFVPIDFGEFQARRGEWLGARPA